MASAQLTLLQRGLPGELLGPGRIGWTNRTRTGFRTSGFPAGAYTIVATTDAGPGRTFAPILWGMTDVMLGGEDLGGVVVTLQPTLTLAGSVRFPSEPASLDRELDMALAPDSADGFPPGEPRRINPAPDGSFAITGLLPGTYRLVSPSSSSSSSGWWLEAALFAGRDVSDRPFAVGPSDDGEDLLLIFSDRAASLSGKLLSADGRPVWNMAVVLFSVDRSDWGGPSRRNSEAQPDASGEFTFGGLPAGEYYVAAVQPSDSERELEPAFYEELVSASVRLTLAPGEQLRRDLRLAR